MYCREKRSSAVRLIAGNRNLVKGYSQSALLLVHNLKQESPNSPLPPWRLRSGGLP